LDYYWSLVKKETLKLIYSITNITPNAEKIYSLIGRGAGIIEDGKISDVYLLSDDEVDLISALSPITLLLPENFKIGVFELQEGKVAFIKYQNKFIGFPIRKDNIMEVIKEIEVKFNDKVLHSQNGR